MKKIKEFLEKKDNKRKRCTKKTELEVHHINRGLTEKEGLNKLPNAEVLCKECHDNVHQRLKKPGGTPDFPETIKNTAKENANNQCQCISENCHSDAKN